MNEHSRESLSCLRAEIEKCLGQCILKLQRYEVGLKRFLSKTVFKGNSESLNTGYEARKARFANQTLGQLIGNLTDECFLLSAAEESFSDAPEEPTECPNLPEITLRFSMQMTTEKQDTLKSKLSEIVLLRNDLVHHFLERFDLQTTASCMDALEHLVKVEEQITHHIEQLGDWDAALRASVQHLKEYLDSEAFVARLQDGPSKPEK